MNAAEGERNDDAAQQLAPTDSGQSGYCQEIANTGCPDLAALDPRLRMLIDTWPHLSEDHRNALVGYIKISLPEFTAQVALE